MSRARAARPRRRLCCRAHRPHRTPRCASRFASRTFATNKSVHKFRCSQAVRAHRKMDRRTSTNMTISHSLTVATTAYGRSSACALLKFCVLSCDNSANSSNTNEVRAHVIVDFLDPDVAELCAALLQADHIDVVLIRRQKLGQRLVLVRRVACSVRRQTVRDYAVAAKQKPSAAHRDSRCRQRR